MWHHLRCWISRCYDTSSCVQSKMCLFFSWSWISYVAPSMLITVTCYTQVTNGAEKLKLKSSQSGTKFCVKLFKLVIIDLSFWERRILGFEAWWSFFLFSTTLKHCITQVEHTFRAQCREFHIFIPCRINLILLCKWYQPFECFINIVGERIISANGPDPRKQSSTALIPVT